MADLRVGCCGWREARARYFAHFAAVEIQDTFYQPPSLERAKAWRSEAPPGFQFAMKAWQLITHAPSSPTYRRLKEPLDPASRDALGSFLPTGEVWSAWQRTLAVARELEVAAIVFQCPASFNETAQHLANLEGFFGRAEREGRLFAWEPRGRWHPEIVREICAKLDLVHCVDPFLAEPATPGPVYLRLHGRGAYRYQYTDADLEQLRALVLRYQAEGRDPIWVMFNNTWMKEDALRFTSLPG